MRILSIILKNYRSHRGEKKFEFDRGINLIIGENGSGKSSILEAIGLALFDGVIRDSHKDAVSCGQKSAVITINFIGDDENEYVTERRIGTSPRWSVKREGEKGTIAEGVDAVSNLLLQLTGIKDNPKQIYNSVICASQNRFVDDFAGSATERDKRFNLLFGTSVYSDLYKLLNSDTGPLKKYTTEKNKLSGKLGEQVAQLKDDESLKENLDNIATKFKKESSVALSIKNEFLNIKTKQKTQESIFLNIKELKVKLKHLDELKLEKCNSKKELVEKLNLSIEAEHIVNDNRANFDFFEKLQSKQKPILEKISEFEKIDVTKQKTGEELLNSKNNLKVQEIKKEELEKQKIELESRIKKGSELIQTLIIKRDSYKKDGEDNQIKLDKSNKLVSKMKILSTEYQELLSQRDMLKIRLNEIEKITFSQENIETQKIYLEKKASELKDQQEKVVEIDKKINFHQAKIEQLIDSQKQLSDAQCPLLDETCQNIKSGTSTNGYFSTRKRELENSLNGLIDAKNILGDVKGDEKRLNREQAQFESKRVDEERRRASVIDLNSKLKLLSNIISDKFTQIKNISNLDISSFEEFKNILDSETANFVKFEERRTTIGELWKSTNIDIKKYELEIDTLKETVLRYTQELQVITEYIVSNINKINSLENTLNKYINELSDFKSLKNENLKLNEVMDLNRNSHTLFIENRKSANQKEDIKKSLDILSEVLKKNKNKTQICKNELLVLEGEFSQEEFDRLTQDVNEYTKKERVMGDRIIELNGEIKEANRQIDENNELKKRIKFTKNEISRVDRKIELTTIFRNNLRGMGKFVACSMVSKIAIKASENYQTVTGTVDKINWLIDDENQYAVYLCRGLEKSNWREFSQLSGGEQVAVALSLRFAMSDHFGGGFTIFDEPTINLDSQRRMALADSLKNILNSIEQVLVVTHDGTFREMAQRVIEL